jgi:hypothetical protein
MILVFLLFLYFKSAYKEKTKIILSFAIIVGVLGFTWVYSISQTEGLIQKRYNNQNASGLEKNDISAGRVNLFLGELEGFVDNPFLGVGANGMKERRIERYGRGVVSHNELSRLLSEHGVIGIIILLILILRPLIHRNEHRENVFFYVFFCFWFATINHSAMRIAAPGFIYGLALLYVINEKYPLRGKRFIAKGEN